MKKYIFSLIIPLLLTACSDNLGQTEPVTDEIIADIPTMTAPLLINEEDTYSKITEETAASSTHEEDIYSETTEETAASSTPEEDIYSETTEETADPSIPETDISSEKARFGVVKTSNYFDEFYAYDHRYLIRSQKELDLFHEYMKEKVITEAVDFENYSVAVIPIQSGSGSYKYYCNGADIGDGTLSLSYGCENIDESMELTCDLAMYYPYGIIPNSMLASESYEGWISPSEADITVYTMQDIRCEKEYSPEDITAAAEIFGKYGAGQVTCVFSCRTDEKPTLMVSGYLSDTNSAKALLNDMTALGFQVYSFDTTVPPRKFRNDTPDILLSLSSDTGASASISADWFTSESFEISQYEDFIAFAENFGGETTDCLTEDPQSEYFQPMYSREWRFYPETTDEITDMINEFLTLPDRTGFYNAHITFSYYAD